MEEFDITVYPEGYERVKELLLESVPEEEREGYMFELMFFMITC